MKVKVEKLAYHRNGIGGWPFYVAIVKEGKSRKVIIRVDQANGTDRRMGGVGCFVLDINLLAKSVIGFTKNSWRGDCYSDLMDKAIAEHERKG